MHTLSSPRSSLWWWIHCTAPLFPIFNSLIYLSVFFSRYPLFLHEICIACLKLCFKIKPVKFVTTLAMYSLFCVESYLKYQTVWRLKRTHLCNSCIIWLKSKVYFIDIMMSIAVLYKYVHLAKLMALARHCSATQFHTYLQTSS